MKTVIHFVDGDVVGGTERVAMQLMTALDLRQWRPVLFHHGAAGLAPMLAELQAAGIETRVVPRLGTIHRAARFPAFVRAIRAERPSVMHAHLSWPLSCKYGLLGASLARVPAVVATAHLYFDVSSMPLVAMQPRFIAKTVHRYLAVSGRVSQQLKDEFRIPPGKVEIVLNGIDLARYGVARSDRVRTDLTGAVDRPLVLTVARLDHQKGLNDLIEAILHVPDAIFVVAGEGPELGALQALARAKGVLDRMRFVGHRDDVPVLLASADLFVLPSLYEGLPLSVMEAMAAGTPVVATDIGGTNELIRSGETGLLVPVAAPLALAESVRSLLHDPARARALAAAAQAQAQRDFGFGRVIRRVTEIYDELLSHNS